MINKSSLVPKNLPIIQEEENEDSIGDVSRFSDKPDEIIAEVPLEDQEIVVFDRDKIYQEYYEKICKHSIFQGFIPTD
jgi:hypothetical protein